MTTRRTPLCIIHHSSFILHTLKVWATAGGEQMNRTKQPCAVVMHMRDGTTIEQVYPTRYQAELFLYLLPLLMSTRPHDEGVASAILSPLIEDRPHAPAGHATPRRIDQYLQ